MKWELPELTEDALVSYLRGTCPGSLRIAASWDRQEMQYPAVVVHVEGTASLSEDAAWHDPRMMTATVAIITEAAPLLDDSQNIIETVRERNIAARSPVFDALFRSDLNAKLIEQDIPAIAFSMAQFTGTERSIDVGTNGQGLLVTKITGEVIAEPVLGS